MASLIITKRQTGDVTILDLNGDVTFGQGNTELRNGIRQELNNGTKKILLNFQSVTYVDSSGIGELISGLTAVHRTGDRQLKLVNLSKRFKELLTITKLLTAFEIFDDEGRAVASFN
jgi:anti-sigma B factor antagonist